MKLQVQGVDAALVPIRGYRRSMAVFKTSMKPPFAQYCLAKRLSKLRLLVRDSLQVLTCTYDGGVCILKLIRHRESFEMMQQYC